MADYDTAIFLQQLRKDARCNIPKGLFNTVTMEQIERAFWLASSEIEMAALQQTPDKIQAVYAHAREHIIPHILHIVTDAGLRIRDD